MWIEFNGKDGRLSYNTEHVAGIVTRDKTLIRVRFPHLDLYTDIEYKSQELRDKDYSRITSLFLNNISVSNNYVAGGPY